MLNKYFLYRHIRNDINQPFYIGIGTKPKKFNGYKTEYKRAFDFSNKKRSTFWFNVYNKADKNITVEILYESGDYDFIKQKEIEFITLYKRKDCCGGYLVNLTSGGEGVSGKIVSELTKKLISEKKVGKKHSQETIERIKKNHASKQPGFVKKVSEETKLKLSKANTGKYLKREIICIETKIKYSSIRELCNDMFEGKSCNKILQCVSKKYVNKSYKGYHFTTDETNFDIDYSTYFKKVVCTENGKTYKTITDCALELFGDKKYKSGISKALKNNTSYKNYNFKNIQ